MHRTLLFLVSLHGVVLQGNQMIHVCQATAIQDLLPDIMEDPVRDLPIVAGVPVARPEMDVIA
jgi:hypothetical protein